jgi:hypothetical protein
MARDYIQVSYFIQELEEANKALLNEIEMINKLTNLSLGLGAVEGAYEQSNIDLYFHACKSINKLQCEVLRQEQLLEALRRELILNSETANNNPVYCDVVVSLLDGEGA